MGGSQKYSSAREDSDPKKKELTFPQEGIQYVYVCIYTTYIVKVITVSVLSLVCCVCVYVYIQYT